MPIKFLKFGIHKIITVILQNMEVGFCTAKMHLKHAEGMTNSVDPVRTAPLGSV